jgi:hypothetical protein
MLLLKINPVKPLTIQIPSDGKWLISSFVLFDGDINNFTPTEINDFGIISLTDPVTISNLTNLDYSIQDDGLVQKLTTGPNPLSAPLVGVELNQYIQGAKYLSKINAGNNYQTQFQAMEEQENGLEQSSWSEQLAEAQAYQADPATPVPLLESLAAVRGVSVADYAQGVITASTAYTNARNVLLVNLKTQYQTIDDCTTALDLKNTGWIS